MYIEVYDPMRRHISLSVSIGFLYALQMLVSPIDNIPRLHYDRRLRIQYRGSFGVDLAILPLNLQILAVIA